MVFWKSFLNGSLVFMKGKGERFSSHHQEEHKKEREQTLSPQLDPWKSGIS